MTKLGMWPLEIESIFSPEEKFFAYYDPRDAASIQMALEDLGEYIASEGPFDAVLAFSMGAGLAASYISHQSKDPNAHFQSVFKCAVFISGGESYDYAAASRGEIRKLDASVDGEIIKIPTASIWGSNDTLWPNSGKHLVKMCERQTRTEYVHPGGHEVPGASRSTRETIPGTVQAIRAAIEAALHAQ